MGTKLLLIFITICGISAVQSKLPVSDQDSSKPSKSTYREVIHHEQDYEPELNMTTVEMIEYFGYPAEAHKITTPDGYILEAHRIPYGINKTEGPRTPVMVQHGLLSSSADFVVNFPNQSLGFMLADAGYDVWITNARGNTYSRNHTTLDPDNDLDFWHFSWDQMAEFDTPTHIDYILNYTNYEQLYYIGHSMGTTMAFALFSTKTEYNDKIKLMLGLGPAANVTYSNSSLTKLAPYYNELEELFAELGIGELLPTDGVVSLFAQDCDDVLVEMCENILFSIMGADPAELNATRLDVYMSHAPAGTSTWTLIHFFQEYMDQRFQHCDWGEEENMQRYGQPTPPEYDIRGVTAPVALFWGANDLLADPTDVYDLSMSLPNLVGSYQVGGANWSHLDFIWGIDDGPLLNVQLIEMMPRF